MPGRCFLLFAAYDEAGLVFTALLAVVLLAVCLFGCGAGFFLFYARSKSAGNEKEASSQELPGLFKHSSKVEQTSKPPMPLV